MKKVLKFVKGRRDDRKEGGITPSQSGDLISPAQTPEDERFLGLDNVAGYIVDFCGKDKTLTKLHKAAWQGNLEKLKTALKKIDIDNVDRHNRTALHFAVVQGHPNIVWFLLGSNARHTICDDDGRTPLLKAVECGHKECMTLLLDRGANINHADFSGISSLHIAVKQGLLDIAGALLEKGADVGVSNNIGEHPLHVAIRTQNREMVQLLLRSGAPVNAVDRENRTPLMLAAKGGNLALAQLFFEYGAQLYVTDSNGWTAEDYALLGGHQSVAIELKTLMKKDAKPTLETHTEEDEVEALKSDIETWNDSHLSDASEVKINGKVGQFLKKFSVKSDEEKEESSKEDDLVESPGSGVVPPPCQPPRSWEIIEAGMIDEAVALGSEPKRRSITALGSLHSRRESFTDTSGNHSDCPKYTLSLNRRKDSKKNKGDIKQRFSFNEEESLKSSLSDDFSLLGEKEKEEIQMMMRFKMKEKKEKQPRSNSGSDWDSNLSSLLESTSIRDKGPSLLISDRNSNVEIDGTLGRRNTLNEVNEEWVDVPQMPSLPQKKNTLSTKLEEEDAEVSSSWDSGESFHEAAFPPPPTAFELGVDMAKSISYIKGISIDHASGSAAERDVWHEGREQAKSLDRLDEKEILEIDPSGTASAGKQHIRNFSVSNQKWHSVELPSTVLQRPSNRLVDVNRRINDQLECYDQALRELAESPYDKRQDAIISTLTQPKQSKVENYYSLPSSKFKTDREFSLTGKTKISKDYAMSLPLQLVKRPTSYCDRLPKTLNDTPSGPMSLPFEVNHKSPSTKQEEVENNETLGFDDNEAKPKEKPRNLQLTPQENVEVDNLESPMSDEQTGSDRSDRKGKRHMLLAMRDVKHAVQVTHHFRTSLDDQILSPLTKVDGEFDLSPKPCESEAASPGQEHGFLRGDSEAGLGRQETVIERPDFRPKSSPSDSGEEPTLWLQDKVEKDVPLSSSPSSEDEKLVEVVGKRVISPSSAESSIASVTKRGRGSRTPSAALRRLQRLGSSSDNEDQNRNEKADEVSPDVSLSSGPIEPLGKDSGSDPDSSHQDPTPAHHYSLKRHQKWLKDRLQIENKERQQLEEVAAQLAEKAERLQYELADAREATKSRDEIINLLQSQLNRMEAAYTKSLEESVHCRLQLTSLEQEMLHLKEICAQYEEEKDVKGVDSSDNQGVVMLNKIKQLEEEREGLSRVVVRLEQENRTLEKAMKSGKEELDEQRWTERTEPKAESIQSQLNVTEECELIEELKKRNCELEKQFILSNKLNLQLETKLNELINCQKLTSNEDISQSIKILSTKNTDMEKQLKILVEELNGKKMCQEDQSIIERLDNEKILLVKSYEQKINDLRNESNVESIKHENEVLRQSINNLKEEISRLKQRPNTEHVNSRLNDIILNDCNIEEEDKLILNDDCLLENCKEEDEIEIHELRKQVASLQKSLGTMRDGMQSQLHSLKGSQKTNEARIARDDELAWRNLYGMDNTRRARITPTTKMKSNPLPEKDSEEFIELKVKELEQELEKAKEEIFKQRLESNFHLQSVIPSMRENLDILELKKKVMELESHAVDDEALRVSLQTKTAEMAIGMKEKKHLELELNNLKSRMQREFVPKIDAEVAKLQSDLLAKKFEESSSSARAIEDSLRERFETLARERDRADALRRRLGRQCVSWEAGVSRVSTRPLVFHSLPREKQTAARFSTPPPPADILSSKRPSN